MANRAFFHDHRDGGCGQQVLFVPFGCDLVVRYFSCQKLLDGPLLKPFVNAVEPIQRIKTCPLELKSHGKRLCSLPGRMDDSLKQMEHAFAATTLQELLLKSNSSVPLCEK